MSIKLQQSARVTNNPPAYTATGGGYLMQQYPPSYAAQKPTAANYPLFQGAGVPEETTEHPAYPPPAYTP